MAKKTRVKDLEQAIAPLNVVISSTTQTGAGYDLEIKPLNGAVATQVSDGTNVVTKNPGDTVIYTDKGVKATVSKAGTNISVQLEVDPSTDTDNALVNGTDGKPYVSKAQLVTGASWSDSTNELTISFANGSNVVIPIVDLIGVFISDFKITDGLTTTTIDNHGTVTYTANNLLKVSVTGNTVNYGIDPTGSTSGDVLQSTGSATSPIWKTPLSSIKDEFETTSLTIGDTTVTLSQTPAASTDIEVFRNGHLLLSSEYSLSSNIITFVEPFGASVGAIFSESVIVKYLV